ncbi:MAG: histidine phosphatase family protein [Planctomycetes bacterium]|nr:histidine phosphatase family protein [Planctomycetota bacterium]
MSATTRRILSLITLTGIAASGAAAGCAASTAPTFVYLVRHAEKVIDAGNDDPDLTAAGRARAEALADTLRSVPLTAIYVTRWKRTQQTADPVARATGLRPIQANEPADELAARIRRDHAAGPVLVVGHSNTVPDLLTALGCGQPQTIGPRDYDDLFLVIVGRTDPARLINLHYGRPNDGP